MRGTRIAFGRPPASVYVALGLVLACTDEPTRPRDIPAPEFTNVNTTDPTRILTVGVDAPTNLTLTGTVAGIVVVVDNAVLDLSKATVDCDGQTGPDPKIGVWIKDNRRNVYLKGGGTGVIENCGIGVLIGPLNSASGASGGSNNRVAGLEIHASRAITVSNSHDNFISSNTVPLTYYGISVIGNDPSASASGKNTIYDNTIATGEYSIVVSSDGNTIRNNVAAGMSNAAIVVDRDGNVISGNRTTALEGEDPPTVGIQLLLGAEDNTVTNNRLWTWATGIEVQEGAFRNLIRGNSAISEIGVDAQDQSGNCVNNIWAKNTFRNSDPLCIVGITLDAVTFTSPTSIQLDGPGATFNSTITNHSTARLTNMAIRAWVDQGMTMRGRRRRVGAWSLVSCDGTPGVLPRGTCIQVGGKLVPSNTSAGSGTLAVDGAVAIIELVHIVDGDTVVVDSRSLPITLTPPAAGSYWEIRAPMPTPRGGQAVGVVNGVLYAVGGQTNTGVTGTLEAYDPVTNTWTTRAPMPTPRYGMAAGVVDGLLYTVGGVTSGGLIVGVVEAYDPVTDTWTSRTSVPTTRWRGLAAGVVGSVLYAVGGVDTTTGLPTGVVEAYDPGTNSWSTKAAIPTPRADGSVGVVNGILYAVGGDLTGNPVTAVEAYDPAANSWTTVAPIPTALWGNAVGVVNGVLYTIGTSWFTSEVGVVEAYDPASNTWTTETPVPTPRYGVSVGAINGVLYTVGGQYGYLSDKVEAYHP